jgi:16S rRNA (uracil1498-N3)-methyltransferase
MAGKRAKIRLFLDAKLVAKQSLDLSRAQAHYLFGVMRLGAGDLVAVFNGQDGEWTCEITSTGKRGGVLSCLEQSAPQINPPDLWLMFAPVKKARTDFIVEKATEMGAARIIPVQTEFTNSERFRLDRQQARTIEAAEQCGGTFVPEIMVLQKLETVLRNWPEDRQIMFCDETLVGTRAALTSPKAKKWAILIGPEGGFSPDELSLMRSLPFVTPVSLGPRILRADTAAVAAMTLWQSTLGDWK